MRTVTVIQDAARPYGGRLILPWARLVDEPRKSFGLHDLNYLPKEVLARRVWWYHEEGTEDSGPMNYWDAYRILESELGIVRGKGLKSPGSVVPPEVPFGLRIDTTEAGVVAIDYPGLSVIAQEARSYTEIGNHRGYVRSWFLTSPGSYYGGFLTSGRLDITGTGSLLGVDCYPIRRIDGREARDLLNLAERFL